MSVYVKLTIDESKTELWENVFVQILISVLSVSLMLNSSPAQNSSNENQIITVAAATQSLFHLQEQRESQLVYDYALDWVVT